jgi:predicted RNase H-like nuclease (RuvC/YqgF family)
LKQGDRVKLITAKGQGVHEVLEIADDKFRVDLDHDDDTAFVFGREVNDFLTVDYDAIAMLNVSATQQLKKELDHEVKTLRAENAELRAANDALAQRLELLESRLEAALGVTDFARRSNGNGWHKH